MGSQNKWICFGVKWKELHGSYINKVVKGCHLPSIG